MVITTIKTKIANNITNHINKRNHRLTNEKRISKKIIQLRTIIMILIKPMCFKMKIIFRRNMTIKLPLTILI